MKNYSFFELCLVGLIEQVFDASAPVEGDLDRISENLQSVNDLVPLLDQLVLVMGVDGVVQAIVGKVLVRPIEKGKSGV